MWFPEENSKTTLSPTFAFTEFGMKVGPAAAKTYFHVLEMSYPQRYFSLTVYVVPVPLVLAVGIVVAVAAAPEDAAGVILASWATPKAVPSYG